MTRVFAILSAILGLVYLSSSSDFWRQLRTFGWSAVSVTVISHTLEPRRMGFWDAGTFGEIRFKNSGDSERVDRIFQRFSFDRSTSKTASYIASLAPGTTHTAFISPDVSEVSFGRFPCSYGPRFALGGLGYLLLAYFVFQPCPRRRCGNPNESETNGRTN